MRLQTTLVLKRKIWNDGIRKSVLNKALTEDARVLEAKLKDNIDESTPAGRYYRIKSATARRSVANRGSRRVRGTTTRVIVGAVFHRASAVSQPPARRFNKLYRSIKVRRVPGKLQNLASVNASGVDVLDDPTRLNRPFFRSVIKKHRADEFYPRIQETIIDLLKP